MSHIDGDLTRISTPLDGICMVGEGATLVAVGLLIGVPGVYFTGKLIRGVLVGVSPSDPLTLLAVALGLGLVAMAACYVPARRWIAGSAPSSETFQRVCD